jgi:hypothetical protein
LANSCTKKRGCATDSGDYGQKIMSAWGSLGVKRSLGQTRVPWRRALMNLGYILVYDRVASHKALALLAFPGQMDDRYIKNFGTSTLSIYGSFEQSMMIC